MARLILQREPLRSGHPTRGQFLLQDGPDTIGLRIDSLELPWANNERERSCIPPGVYQMKWTKSTRFGRFTWELFDVPMRTAIRIHSGNYAGPVVSNSLGCILPCLGWADLNKDGIIDGTSSRLATAQLEAVLEPYKENGIEIQVKNA